MSLLDSPEQINNHCDYKILFDKIQKLEYEILNLQSKLCNIEITMREKVGKYDYDYLKVELNDYKSKTSYLEYEINKLKSTK